MIEHLYIECTHTATSGLNTGIQRVVRRVIDQLGDQLSSGAPISLITIQNGQFHHLDTLPDLRPKKSIDTEKNHVRSSTISIKTKLFNVLRAMRAAIVDKISWAPLHDFLSAPRTQRGLSGIIYTLTLKPIKILKQKVRVWREIEPDSKVIESEPKVISFSQGDVILMLDSSLHLPAWKAITDAQNNGAKCIAVIYDLIPVTHPQFCNQALTDTFQIWIDQAKNKLDGYIAISQTVQKSLQHYLATRGTTIDAKRLAYFYLGAEFSEQEDNAREGLKNTVLQQDSYLIVSTIEPRKNHQYLVDVFSELWLQGYQVKLHIVGWVGWKVDELIKQIKQHPQFNKQLFLWNDLDDSELIYCYKNSKALVFPSIIEGFGLPIIEAQHYQLPALVSDTEIHREIGGDSVIYFDIDNKQDLITKISQIEQGELLFKDVNSFDINQFTWENSANMLTKEIQRIKAEL